MGCFDNDNQLIAGFIISFNVHDKENEVITSTVEREQNKNLEYELKNMIITFGTIYLINTDKHFL
jgi:hypothetical protein